MQITVKLFATFRVGRFKEQVQQRTQGVTCRQITDELGITEGEVGIILVNGRHAALDHPLADGDSLSIFPLVGGG